MSARKIPEEAGSRVVRVLLIDDHAIVREGLRSALELMGSMECFEASSAEEALRRLRSGLQIDAVVMDFGLPGLDGLDAIGLIHDERKKLPVLIFSMQTEEKLAARALELGAAGFISKSSPNAEVVKAVLAVVAGRQYVSRQFAARLDHPFDKTPPAEAHEALSTREFETMHLIAAGKSLMQIAEALNVCKTTANTYRARLMKKLNVSSNHEIVRYAVDKGLVG